MAIGGDQVISHHKTPRHARASRPMLFGVVVALLLGVLTFSNAADSRAVSAQDCPEGSVLSDNGVTCELDVSQTDSVCPSGKELDAAGLMCVDIEETGPNAVCPAGQQLDAAGLMCVDSALANARPTDVCPPGQKLDAAGLVCVENEQADDEPEDPCQPGYSVGADGETCIATPKCERNEVLGDDGTCVESFRCPAGNVLASDLLTCLSDGCPAGELLSVDGKRCLAKERNCPDGSPRPIGGACLVVETIEGENGTEVIVRCAEADAFCQAQIKLCAEQRASGETDLGAQCEDPRGSCDPDDEACAEANDRLVECATRDLGDEDEADAEPVAIGGSDDPCDDLCPELHRLDPSGECVEFLDPTHPCVIADRVPSGVTTNRALDGYSYLAGTDQCVTRSEFLRRLGNFEAAAGAEADALTLLRETTSSYLTVEGQLAELEQRLIDTEREIRQYTKDAADADARRIDNIKRLAATEKNLARERSLLRSEVLHVFVVGGNDAIIESAILHATNVTEIGVARTYGRALLDDQLANIELVERLEAETRDLAVSLDNALAEVQASLASAVAASESLEVLLADAEALRTEQLARRDEEAEMVAELRENKALYARELGIFEQATLEITEIIANQEFRVTTFAEFDGLLANPILPRSVVSSGFGPRLHPILGYVRNHNGVDITAGFGREISASGAGVVQIASSFGGYGKTVVIDHGGGILTLYAHMSVIAVDVGEEVELGEIIGFVGSTGLSTGPHLHFEVWEDGKTAVDPIPYLSDLG